MRSEFCEFQGSMIEKHCWQSRVSGSCGASPLPYIPSEWGELLYISGGISPWTTLLFPESPLGSCSRDVRI